MADTTLDFLYHHVFLPTEVPQRSDTNNGRGDRALVEVLLESVDAFRAANDYTFYNQWSTIQRSFRTFALLHSQSKSLSSNALKSSFRNAADGEIIILHIALQNSGLIIEKKTIGYVIETFEASPRSADVLAAQAALEWDFPSRAVVVPHTIFEDEAFQDSLAIFLEKASLEPVKQYAATTLKAGSNAYESRDTTFPAIIGQLLMTILEAVGRKHTPTLTRKRVRDEVCWSDGAENPWRRSATWLVLRVATQRILCSLLGPHGIFHYKFFMCSLMSSICTRFCNSDLFPTYRLAFARTKLARRIAKLEAQGAIGITGVSEVVHSLFSRSEAYFTKTLRAIETELEERGKRLRTSNTKKMYRLPNRADPESTILSLHHSRTILERIVTEVLYGRSKAQVRLPHRKSRGARYNIWKHTQNSDHLSTTDYHCLADMEAHLAVNARAAMEPSQETDIDRSIQKLGNDLRIYQFRACIAYKENVEQSSTMLLTLMEVWVGLDSLAVRQYPLLVDYDPGFPMDLMYPLKLAFLSDMVRLQNVETYLEERRKRAIYPLSSVLGNPTRECFAVRYFDQCAEMQDLLSVIQRANDSARSAKERELSEQTANYQAKVKQASETACLYRQDEYDPLKRQHDDRHCRKHFLEREAARMQIRIHEDYLPADDVYSKSVVFELLLPSSFATWRDSTWHLLTLARGDTIPDQKPRLMLCEYSALELYAKGIGGSVTLASRTKSFHDTHYATVPLPTQLEQVCLPHGLKYGMYDCQSSLWTSRHLEKPSFAEICTPNLPSKSAWLSLKRFVHPTFNDVYPTANEISASQTRCPNNLTIAEYTSFQDIRLGHRLQWLKILRELISSNINFGSVEITTLVTELALGAGPPEGIEVLRTTHWVFNNQSFCHTLALHVKRRLDAIASNWREGQLIECLLVLLQRLWSLGSTTEVITEARELILYVRNMTRNWIRMLRREISNAVDIETSQKRSRESLHAALLCRKTFMIEAAKPGLEFQEDAFACFLECAFTIKDYLSSSEPGYIAKLPAAVRSLYVGDLKLVHSLESRIRWSVQHMQAAVSEAVNSVWMEGEGDLAREFSTWTVLPAPHDTWVTAQSVIGEGTLEQSIHFDMLEGTLYIDGQLLGRLPEEFSKEDFFQQLFGNRIFLTRPSYLKGMSYMFVSPFENHEVHFGFREGHRFMRIRHRSTGSPILEFLPASIFLGNQATDAPDLPLPLVLKCVHWLNFKARVVEARPIATMWRSKISDWQVDLEVCQGIRRKKSLLVDPRSSIFGRVAHLIEPFEHRGKLVIYQPLNPNSNLTVDLPALELSFRVNFDGLLESRQLRAHVDLNQDAGTLYGLRSSLVLRDSVLHDNRSVLVAMGPASIERNDSHVNVSISHTGFYARFLINKLLGRLECAAEPRLLYFKAYCHAITSSVHPDLLTGRTGTEEALSCLQAANAQPWMPLDGESYRMLSSLGDLTPSRIYYPENLRALQRILWDDKLMPASQSGRFRPVVEDILQQCAALHRFHLDSGAAPAYERQGDAHLHERALFRAQSFQSATYISALPWPPDTHYDPRDLHRIAGCKDTHEAVVLISRWSRNIAVCPDLPTRLQEWPLIQGFIEDFQVHLLSSLINFEPASNWGSLFRLCQQSQGEQEKIKLLFLFGTMAFGGQIDMTLIRTLIAVAVMDESRELELPQCAEFVRFRRSQVPTVELLAQYIRPHRAPYPEDERALISITMHSKQRRKLELAQKKFEEASEEHCKTLARYILSQWPTRKLTTEELPSLPLLDVQNALVSVLPEWERLSDNYHLYKHLIDVQKLLKLCKAPVCLKKPSEVEECREWYPCWKPGNVRPRMQDLLLQPLGFATAVNCNTDGNHVNGGYYKARKMVNLSGFITNVPSQPVSHNAPFKKISEVQAKASKEPTVTSELSAIVNHFASNDDPVRSAYGRDLQISLLALQKSAEKKNGQPCSDVLNVDISALFNAIASFQEEIQTLLDVIRGSLIKGHKWLRMGGLLPILTPLTLLENLRNGADEGIHGNIKADLLHYAEVVVGLQQLLRVRDAHLLKDQIQLANERRNVAHVGWKPEDHIDWLLLEIDFNLIIREDQLLVAQAMIASPKTVSNFVLQMNMGQGKSSVIIPMVATALAKDKNLVRVVVPRSLLLQAAQILSSRLGGLINRRIKHIPFSRKSRTDFESIKAYHGLHMDIFNRRGVLLALPEHLLSFQLSGLQELSNGRISDSTYMIKLQAWFSRRARDVLDECDHMLAVKTQLIYPSGAQSPVDGHPNRWKLVQTLLKLAKTHFKHLRREFPRSLEVIERSSGAFPTVYFLDQPVKDVFLKRLTDSVLRGDGGLLPVQECSKEDLACAADFLHHAQFAKSTASKIAQVFKNKKDARSQLLLLRGLLVHKILLMGLGKRWNVQYGIHPLRDPIAVPFRSKGIPSDQAEFGHPDVSIMLTCLSFYNTGLNLRQFQDSLGLLLKSDEPVREFESWILEAQAFPESLSSWNAINIDDETQCTALWNHLRLQMSVINFFLNHFVFPRHAKTFDRKLVSSGWDIATPLPAAKTTIEKNLKENHQPGNTAKRPVGGVATALTVGFSGTNDNKTLLPLNVLQNDLPGLSHTNAEVLTYLLQPRNRRYVPACDARGRRVTERKFLHMLEERGIRMLLDAGAQILELDNIALVKAWLEIDTRAEAGVFFGEDERARVVYRDGKVQPLAASPYLDNLGACVVYLDEAHTRGVDLKMPPHAVAALTLGVMQTKDHTVQAAMRLRQLAISQSVIFFAPPEVHQSILNTRKTNTKSPIDSHDVIIWLLEQTCCNIEQLQPLYVSQGLEYCRRRVAAQRFEDAEYHLDYSRAYLNVLEQPEKYSLEDLYAPDRRIKIPSINTNGNAEIARYVKRLDGLKTEIRNTGDTVQALAHQEVEQEREVAIEVETVRELKKPHHAQPCSQQTLHRDIRSYAETGRLVAGSHEYIQAFVALRQTAIGRRLGISDSATRSGLYITQDFSKTVIPDHSGLPRDEYSRPIHWLLWSMVTSTALIISDYEANTLIPLIRDANPIVVHLISYAAPITKSMVLFDDLKFFSIPLLPHNWKAPTWLVRDLGIFAGRTYFDYNTQYSAICEALGLPVPISRAADLHAEMPFAALEDEKEMEGGGGPFSPSPLLFMQEWLAVRRKGQDFSQTMMGEMCRGRRLDVPEEISRDVDDGEGEDEMVEDGSVVEGDGGLDGVD